MKNAKALIAAVAISAALMSPVVFGQINGQTGTGGPGIDTMTPSPAFVTPTGYIFERKCNGKNCKAGNPIAGIRDYFAAKAETQQP